MSLLAICSHRQLELYWLHVNRDGPVVVPALGPCWQWTLAPMTVGYGLLSLGSARDGSCAIPGRALAREYGVSKTAIQRIRQRKSWAHI